MMTKCTSPLAVLELKSVLDLTTTLVTYEKEAFIYYLSEIDIKVPEVDMDKVVSYAIELAVNTRTRTLYKMHLAAGVVLEADDLVTFDREFLEKEKKIANI
jgi:predicted house-cleaning NTP pyrophosphatase (Maf/HAM1 superfamily)